MWLWLVEGWLVVTTVAYSVHCARNKGDKVRIMSVRSELKQIKRLDDADRKSMF